MQVSIRTDNGAFSDEEGGKAAECARILRDIADKLESGHWEVPRKGTEYPVYDHNGNKVGKVRP